MLCKNCGAQLPDGTERCEFCGADLAEELEQDTMVFDTQELEAAEENAEEAEEEIVDENELNRRAQMEKMMAEKQLQLSEIEKRRNIKKKRQKQTKIAIICAICAACVAVVGFGSYAVKESLSNGAEPSPSPIPTVAATTAVPTPLTTTPAPLSSMDPNATPSSVIGTNASQSGNVRPVNGSNGSGTASGSQSGSVASNSASSSNRTSSSNASSSSGSGSSSSGSSQSGSGSSASNSSVSATSVAKPSGISTATVDAKLTTGGEVIYNSDTGKYLMTFATGNTLYYANVSEGSTTEQIKNKNITITAHPTSERYKGNTIYEITGMTYYDDSDYILAQSGTKILTKDDVKNMSKKQLALARNEIYARHGRRFNMAEFRDYFSTKSWYKENPNYNYDNEGSNLNEIEAKNVNFLLSIENSK